MIWNNIFQLIEKDKLHLNLNKMIQIKDEKKFNQVEDYDVSDLRWRGTNARNECLGYIGTVQINV